MRIALSSVAAACLLMVGTVVNASAKGIQLNDHIDHGEARSFGSRRYLSKLSPSNSPLARPPFPLHPFPTGE